MNDILKDRREYLAERFKSEVRGVELKGFNNVICAETGVRFFFKDKDNAEISISKTDAFRKKNPQLTFIVNKCKVMTNSYSGYNFPYE